MITYPLLSQNCHESQFLTGIVQSRFPYLLFWICLGDFPQQYKENATTQLIYFTLWPVSFNRDSHTYFFGYVWVTSPNSARRMQLHSLYISLYGPFSWLQTLSKTFKHFQTLSGATRTDKSSQQLLPSSCCDHSFQCTTTSAEDSKQLNIVF